MRGLRQATIGVLCALALSLVPMSVAVAADEDAGHSLTSAYNSSGQQLFRKLAEKPGNIVLSPLSIGTAMTMALAGARGETAAEMAKVMALSLAPDQVNAASAAVLASLNAVSSASFQLLVANAGMLANKGDVISDDYVALLKRDFAAELFRGADLATVNGWVKDKTKGKIDSILDRVDPSTALVLLDAVYFKAPWDSPFHANSTRDEAFHLAGGEAMVPTMHIYDEFSLAKRPGYRAIRLPYAGGRFGMVVMLPDATADDLVQRFDGAEMQALLTALRVPPSEADVSLPRFQANFRADLASLFAGLGMHRAFDPASADLSGMTGQPPGRTPLAIDQIVHRAVIEVAEEGTVAAAATGVSVVATAMAPQPAETFKVDRPFLFAIVDGQTGAVLFEGRIADPR